VKQLPIQSENFQYIEHSFKQWLDVLGYVQSTVQELPNRIREFFNWLEKRSINNIKQLTGEHIKSYYKYIKQRPHSKESGALSSSYINKHRFALIKFTEYLRQSGRYELPHIELSGIKHKEEKLNTLTPDEVKQLFAATYIIDGSNLDNELAIRDRAILVILYGCGLRRNEATHLNLEDVNIESRIVHVKKGKGNKERLVPINKSNIKYLEDYIYNARPVLMRSSSTIAFFVSNKSQRIGGQTMNLRLRIVVAKTNNPELIEKAPSLHTLRHSIATHLLQNGMTLEQIAKFLGHSSLDSTQIYTHLINEEQPNQKTWNKKSFNNT
jgi:integrase/recombinase XerD